MPRQYVYLPGAIASSDTGMVGEFLEPEGALARGEALMSQRTARLGGASIAVDNDHARRVSCVHLEHQHGNLDSNRGNLFH